jgi:hypothetical protein
MPVPASFLPLCRAGSSVVTIKPYRAPELGEKLLGTEQREKNYIIGPVDIVLLVGYSIGFFQRAVFKRT